MTQVVQAHAVETGTLADAVPGVIDVALMRAPLLPREHPRIAGYPRQVLQHLRHRRRHRHQPGSGLRIAQAKLSRLEVHVLPAQAENLISPAPGEHQQPDGRRSVPRGQPFGRCGVKGASEPAELVWGEEPLVLRLNLVPTHESTGILPRWTQLPHLGQVEHLDEHVERPIRHRGLLAQLVVERQNVLALDLGNLELSESRHDVLGEHDAVVGRGRRPAAHRDVLALVALGKVGHRGVGLRCGRDGLFSGLDAGNDASGFLAGLVG